MSRILIIVGVLLVLTGLLWPLLVKGPLGPLPGDIVVRRERVTVYLPIMTSLLLSVLLSMVLWLFAKR